MSLTADFYIWINSGQKNDSTLILRKNMHNKVLFQPLVIWFSKKWLFSDNAIISIMNDDDYGTTKKLMKSWDNTVGLFSLYLQRLGSYKSANTLKVWHCTIVFILLRCWFLKLLRKNRFQFNVFRVGRNSSQLWIHWIGIGFSAANLKISVGSKMEVTVVILYTWNLVWFRNTETWTFP